VTVSPSTSSAILEAELRSRGLLPADAPAMAPPSGGRPWFVSVLLGVSGWLAGLTCLGFLAILFQPDGEVGIGLLGAASLAGAYALYRSPVGAFVEQLALAFGMAGHVALAVAFGEASDSPGGTALAVALLQLAWLAVVPNRAARVLSAAFASIAWALAIRFAWWGDDFGRHGGAEVSLGAALVGWFLVWGPVLVAARALVATEPRWMASGRARLLRPLLVGLLVALTFGTVASQPLQGLLFWEPDGERTSWLALWPLLSTGAALYAMALAHLQRSRALIGAAIAAALLHVFHFYMLLGSTLLTKAAIMAVIGALLLASALLLDRRGRAA
jgi:hypothetical protein